MTRAIITTDPEEVFGWSFMGIDICEGSAEEINSFLTPNQGICVVIANKLLGKILFFPINQQKDT